MTEAVSDLTTDTAGTNTTALNQSLDTLAATLDQIAPQMGPAFDALTRLSRTLNSRNKNLGELFKSAGDVTGILSERSMQVNKLILNSDALLQVLVARRQEVVDLLANTSAVAKQLTALVHDNEATLAPTLERLNRVTGVLEKNRDNIGKALPGLAKFQITVGEAIAGMYAYQAFVPNFLIPQLFQELFDYLWGFRTFDTSKGPGFPSPVPRALTPGPTTPFQCALAARWADGLEDHSDFWDLPDPAQATGGRDGGCLGRAPGRRSRRARSQRVLRAEDDHRLLHHGHRDLSA